MKKIQCVARPLIATGLLLLTSLGAAYAATDVPASQAASAVKVTKPVLAPATGKVLKGEVSTAGGVLKTPGDNQYPNGTLPIPPKPKKEGLEAAGAVKAKTAQP